MQIFVCFLFERSQCACLILNKLKHKDIPKIPYEDAVKMSGCFFDMKSNAYVL